jgi:hypothetical protein
MSFDVSLVETTISTDSTALKSFRDELNLALGLDETLTSFLEPRISGVSASATNSRAF